ncbi:hypothetical protein [Streptomyces zaomyceticus]|uniref:hypothetical protein n=1 Tax=Streptomyces zaomyceticus TaxID=68286 RepID=UPI003436DC00
MGEVFLQPVREFVEPGAQGRRVGAGADRRRKIVSIAPAHSAAIDGWLGRSAGAWRAALAPLDAAQRRMFLETLTAYERGLSDPLD